MYSNQHSMSTRGNFGLVTKLKVLVEEKNTHCCLCGRFLELPKDLPCKHTFCRSCLQQFCLTNALEDRFPCPECHVTIQIADPNVPIMEWVDTIPTNEETEKRLQAARQIESEKKKKVCTLCRIKWKKIAASKYCKACEEYFCDECGNQHWLLRKSKQHRVWYIEDFEAMKRDPLLRSSLDLIFNTKLIHTRNPIKTSDDGDTDMENCMITGATFLPGGELVLVDKSNQKLKYFDKHHRFVASTPIQCHDVLAFNKGFVIASCPSQNQLKSYSIHGNDINAQSVIELEASCYGLCHIDDGHDALTFVVTLSSRPVKILFYTGMKQTKAIPISTGAITMLCPSHIAYIKSDMAFVLLDDAHACVKCINNGGDIIWEKRIENCKGLVVFDNHILLGRSDRKTVDLVNISGKILKSVVTDIDGVSNINCLCADHWRYSRNSTRLLVGDNTNLVRVFLLEDPLQDDDIQVYVHRKSTASASFSKNSDALEPKVQPKVCTLL